ncbi:LOW QUALITY PROTEIN: nicotinamide N-methyltransferase [Cyanocitta cristata]
MSAVAPPPTSSCLLIITLDYTDQNHREMNKWLKNEAGTFHWEPAVKICELEGDREKWAEKQEKLRKMVKQVLKCDVTKANPRGPVSLLPADCIVSTLCLEGACKDLATFRSALRNIGTLLKPGEHLVMVTALGDTYYTFNKQAFSCLCLQKHKVVAAVVAAGCEVKFSDTQPYTVNNDLDLRAVLGRVAQRCPSATA